MLFIILSLTGFFVGLLSAFFGVGGGVLIVPVLYGLFPSTPPAVVIGTSLTVIFFNSIVNTYNFRLLGRKTRLDWGALLALGMMIGVFSSSFVVQHINPKTVRLIFAIVLVLTGARTLFFKAPEQAGEEVSKADPFKSFLILLTGLFGGLIAGLTGLGGGIVMVPLLLTIHKLPLPYVPVYSNLAMIGGTFVGMVRYAQISSPEVISKGLMSGLQVGSVQFAVAGLIFLGSFFSSKLGAKLSQKVSRTTSKRLFVLLLAVMSMRILISIYGE